jgi:hypothetical protein
MQGVATRIQVECPQHYANVTYAAAPIEIVSSLSASIQPRRRLNGRQLELLLETLCKGLSEPTRKPSSEGVSHQDHIQPERSVRSFRKKAGD